MVLRGRAVSSDIIAAVVGSRPFRSGSLESQLGASGLTVVEVPARLIDPGAVSNFSRADLARILYSRELRAGEVGCALAHLQVYAAAITQRAEWALVFEDDAELVDLDTTALVSDLRAACFSGATIVVLFSTTGIDAWKRRGAFRGLMTATTHTVAYAINHSAMKLALDAPTQLVSSADWPPWSTEVKFYRWTANYDIQHPEGTTILGRRAIPSKARVWRLGVALRRHSEGELREYFPTKWDLLKWMLAPPTRRVLTKLGVDGNIPRQNTSRSRSRD